MEAILDQRFSFCDFSNVVGFPNPMRGRGEWEGTLPTFKGEYWEVSAEHLLDFHEFVMNFTLCMRMSRSNFLDTH